MRDAMAQADGWFMCRAGYVETIRAVGLAAGKKAAKTVREEWPATAPWGPTEIERDLHSPPRRGHRAGRPRAGELKRATRPTRGPMNDDELSSSRATHLRTVPAGIRARRERLHSRMRPLRLPDRDPT